MTRRTPPRDAGIRDRLLFLLKTRGPATTAALAQRVDRTEAGTRQQLARLADEGLVRAEERRDGEVGRPAAVWHLTEAATSRFPEGYADLAVELLGHMRETFGEEGVEALIASRARAQSQRYADMMPAVGAPLSERVAALARLRRDEGYMAEWSRRADGSFRLVENHCPICVAAQICQGLCGQELELFRSALGPDVLVERDEHILAGARRCTYCISAR